MFRTIISLLVLLILSIGIVLAAPGLNVVQSSLNAVMSQNQQKNFTVNVQNTGNTNLTLEFDTSDLDLTDNDNDMIEVNFPFNLTVSIGETANVTFTIETPSLIDFETFGGQVNVNDLNSNATDNFNLNIEVEPDVCDFGEVGDDLEMDIQEPNGDDEFKPGDEIDIGVEVKNNGINDIDVRLEAFLFAEAQEIADATSESKNIEDGDEEEFDFKLNIPLSNEELGEDEDVRLFIKAFDDENEQLNCVQESIDLDFELPDKEVVIDDRNMRFSPSSVKCGDSALATIRVINIGDDDVTGFLTVENRELKISKRSNNIKLEDFESGEDNDAFVQIPIEIPKGVKAKEYVFDVRSSFNGESTTAQLKLNVAFCEEEFFEDGVISPVGVNLLESDITTTRGSILSIPVELTNNQNGRITFFVSLANIGEFAESQTVKTVTLNPGQTSIVYLDLVVNDDAEAGLYTGSVDVRSGTIAFGSATFNLEIADTEIAAEQKSFSEFVSGLPLAFWAVLNAILIGLVVLSVRVINLKVRK